MEASSLQELCEALICVGNPTGSDRGGELLCVASWCWPKARGLSEAVLRDGSSGRGSFVFLWVVDTEEAKTELGFMGKSQLKEGKRFQCEAQSGKNQCGETSHG